MKTRTLFQLVALIGASLINFDTAKAGYAIFANATDTIEVASGFPLASSFTYEAQILLSASYPNVAMIFNDWFPGVEDKQFAIGPSFLQGYAYPVPAHYDPFYVSAGVTLNTWHHFAYVYDGLAERLYLDGILMGSRSTTGDVANTSANYPHVGAIFRDGALFPSFIGSIDSLRISSNARYTTPTFVPPTGDFVNDASTLLLYNFNQPAGTTVIPDESGHGHTGTLGIGFAGVTSPTFATTTIGEAVLSIAPAAAISWQSLNGNFYQPQVASSLTTPDWSDFGLPLVGNGSLMRVFDTIGGASQKFYRVIITTSP